jgi:hypothetical protein
VDLANRIKKEVSLFDHVTRTTGGKISKHDDYELISPCPVCGHNDCFSIKGELYKCFSCGAAGSIIDYEVATGRYATAGAAIAALAVQYSISDSNNGNGKEKKDKPHLRLLKKSEAMSRFAALAWVRDIRGFGQYAEAAADIMTGGEIRQLKYGNADTAVIPLLYPSDIAKTDLDAESIASIQLISLTGSPLPGATVNKIFPRGCKGKGCFPLIRPEGPIIIVESFANALALYAARFSAVTIFSTSNVDLVAGIKKILSDREIVLCLDRGVEDKSEKCCKEAALRSMWWPAAAKNGYDVNDLLRDDSQGFAGKIKDMLAAASKTCPYALPNKREAVPGKRPEIIVEGGQIHAMIDSVEERLGGMDLNLYHRAGNLVHICGNGRGIRQITPPSMVDLLTRHVAWKKWDSRNEAYKPVDCPTLVVDAFMARPAWDCIRPLRGIITCPTLRPDGSILAAAGYDSATGLFMQNVCGASWNIPENPTLAQAQDAMLVLLDLVKDFPFYGVGDSSVFVASLMTGLGRHLVSTAPLFCYSAPKMGAGKSLLVQVISIIVTGLEMFSISQAKDSDEEKKCLLSILIAGNPIVCFDDCEKPIESAALCSILTQRSWAERILGQNTATRVDTASTTWFATGNNLQIRGDMSTRALICRLNPQCERPEEREFTGNLKKYVLEHRQELVTAVLTILRAYFIAGCPRQNIKPFGRFEEWSDLFRGALVWAGMDDPCLTRATVEDSDTKRDQLKDLLAAWGAACGDRDLSAKEALSIDSAELRAAFEAIDTKLDLRRIGAFLKKNADRIEGGSCFTKTGKNRYGTTWKVRVL